MVRKTWDFPQINLLLLFQLKQNSSNSQRRIIYGSSTLNNAKQFLKQLSLLGQEINNNN